MNTISKTHDGLLRELCGRPAVRKGIFLAFLVICVNLLAASCGQSTPAFAGSDGVIILDEVNAQEMAGAADVTSAEIQDIGYEGGMSVTDGTPLQPGENESSQIVVFVCGAVANEGVVTLPEHARIFEAVEAAGGFLPEADTVFVNQAMTLSDGDRIYIPTREETEALDFLSGRDEDTRININTASEEALQTLTGIGPGKAKAIVAYREEHGYFEAEEDLMKVSGIGQASYEKLRDEIRVN